MLLQMIVSLNKHKYEEIIAVAPTEVPIANFQLLEGDEQPSCWIIAADISFS